MFSKKICSLIRLLRPELSLSAGICTITGQILAVGGLPSPKTIILGFLCVFCLSGSALILNDYFDYEVDKVNAPGRPLPSGAVSRKEVLLLNGVTTLVGLATATMLGTTALVVGIVIWFIGFLYNSRYKRTGLPGNLLVSTSVAATFIFGAITTGDPWNCIVWIFSLMAFFIDLGEELAGDAMDMEGDKKLGSRSLALLKGRDYALRVSVIVWGVVILLGLVPIITGWMGVEYLIFIVITDTLLVFFSYRLLQSNDSVSGHKAMRGIYLGVTLAVIAFLVGQLIR